MKAGLIGSALVVFGLSPAAFGAQALSTQDRRDVRDEVDAEMADIDAAFGASEDADHSDHQARRHNACKKVKFDEEQKTALKEAIYELRKEQIPLHAQLKLAKLEYEHAVTMAEPVRGDVDAAGAELSATTSKMVTSAVGFSNKLLLEIAKPEQRKATYQCLELVLKAIHGKHQCQHGRQGRHDGRDG